MVFLSKICLTGLACVLSAGAQAAIVTTFTLLPANVPEPGVLLLLAAGIGSLLGARHSARPKSVR